MIGRIAAGAEENFVGGIDATTAAAGGNTNQQHWIGNLDDFRIYDTALTDTELDTIYTAVLVPEPSTALLMLGGAAGLAGIRRRK